MASFLTGFATFGSTPLLEKFVAFTEARHRVLVENVANIDTPGYRTRQVDASAFQTELKRAATDRRRPDAQLKLRDSSTWRVDDHGALRLTPKLEPAENTLLHDGTNTRLERQMSLLAENGMAHQAAVTMLKNKYDGLMTAIRGRTT
ncbi:MAG: flagellar basal body rod protein FlgB [Phycisphaerae bacterium]|nr:flagellar basal body rod protein FlgB [Phycisphaerae bacterium]NUQ44963.1 flagellar basal body rod protein FlgB [Phycisphaerae bacterium]